MAKSGSMVVTLVLIGIVALIGVTLFLNFYKTCSDFTFYGKCSSTKPKYCSNGYLIDRCYSCGCSENQTCNTSSNRCMKMPPNFTSGGPTCTDGTLYGQCSATKPKYCSNGNLIDNCATCGCASDLSCNSTTNLCSAGGATRKCSDNTVFGQCSATRPLYCNNGALVNYCRNCGCPSGQQCNITSEACYWPPCGDVPLDQCSPTKPGYCSNNKLISRCTVCGCPDATIGGYFCDANSESCYLGCSDGTSAGQCSQSSVGKTCQSDYTLADSCSVCGGCNYPLACNSTSNTCYTPTCYDGTFYEQCSVTKPYFCRNGAFIGNCTICQCPEPQATFKGGGGTAYYACDHESGYCYSSCSDGTRSGECSTHYPGKYCFRYILTDSCVTNCPCPSGYQCNAGTLACDPV